MRVVLLLILIYREDHRGKEMFHRLLSLEIV